MNSPVYVVGHRNPDTDAIVSAIGYAEYRRRTGMPEAQAARLGEPNAETRYLLDRFETPAPVLLHDVYTRVSDVMNSEPRFLTATSTMREAGPVMRDKRIVPVVDGDRRLLGVVTLDDVAARYLQELDLASGVQNRISYGSIITTLDGELLAGDRDGDWRGSVWVAAMDTRSVGRLVKPGDLLVVGDRPDVQMAALEAGAACLVLVGNAEPSEEALARARKTGTRLIRTPHHSYRVTRLLNLSIPVTEVMRRDVPTAEPDDLADEAGDSLSQRNVALPVVDGDRRLVGVVSRSDLLRARGKRVILVDHNHRSQSVEGLEEARLLEVVDHHNLGDLNTPEPVYIRMEPVGSTSTIVAELFRQTGEAPDAPTAGLLAGGIVSDTLLFRSPTTTQRDRAAGEWLAGIAGLNLEGLAVEMFRAASNYENTSPAQLLTGNLKVYEWGGKKVAIGQAETVEVDYFRQRMDTFRDEMRSLKATEGWDYVFFLVTDILAQDSLMLLPGDEERMLAERAFQSTVSDSCTMLSGVVSRKKQVVPPLARALG